MSAPYQKNWQYYKFCLYGFLKNLRFFEPFLILFLRERGLSWDQVGILYSIRFITRFILEIPSGIIADSLGRRGTMLFSYALYLLSFPSYYFSHNFYLLIIPTLLFGIGDAFRTGTHKAMIFEYLKHKGWQDAKVDYYGHTRSWSQAGSAISSVLAALVVIFSGRYDTVFLYSILPYLIGFALLASYPAYLEGKTALDKNRQKKHNMRLIFKTTLQLVTSFLQLRQLLGVSLPSGYYMAVKDYLQPVIKSFAITLPIFTLYESTKREALVVGIVYFLLYFSSSFSARRAGKVDKLFKNKTSTINWLMVIGLLAGLVGACLLHFELFIPAIVMFFIIHMNENIRRPASVAYITEQNDEKILASILSVESQLGSLIAALIALAIGYLVQYFDLALGVVVVSVVMVVVGGVLWLRR